MKNDRVYNFSAGPAALPEPVLETMRDELLNYGHSGMSVMEMSHRSKEFTEILETAEADLRSLLNVSEDYAVLFIPGGASAHFAMAPVNLAKKGQTIEVLHTGYWTEKALEEIKKVTTCHLAASGENEGFKVLPPFDAKTLNPSAAYLHLCSNNTIYGTQWKSFPNTGSVPLVADMSSDILSRPIDITQFGLVFAGAQKNAGMSGLSIGIIRKDLAERCNDDIPAFWQYRSHIKGGSRYNTPPSYSIYTAGLIFKWVKEQGGLKAMETRAQEKSGLLYNAIDGGDFYSCPIRPEDRSSMNIVFRIKDGDEALEAKFVKEATAAGLSGLKGHRAIGGLRASIYNAHPLEGVQALTGFMREFAQSN